MLRLDEMLVAKGVYDSRTKAKEAILAGRVTVDGKVVTKPAYMCTAAMELVGLPWQFISRGGYKLQQALTAFQIDLTDRVCLDIGASTGGFTQACLLNGARQVYAVDVGQQQLAPVLKQDSRVVSWEKTNYLQLAAERIRDVTFACIDVAYVSLTKLVPKLAADQIPEIVALVKPQFECGATYARQHHGIVKDVKMHQKVLQTVVRCFTAHGFISLGIIPSPIKGGDGNTEFLVHLVRESTSDVNI